MKGKVSRASGARRGRRLRRDGVAAMLLCVTAFAAACSGPGGSAIPGYVNGSPPTPLAFAQCMRAHGVPGFPDPSNGQFNLAGINQNSPQFVHAGGICGPSGGNAGASQQAQNVAQALKFARCMRAHGVTDFPDPTTNGNGGNNSQSFSASGNETAVFQKALATCRPLLSGGSSGGGGTP
ncbi:MAG TPA: hypothetical protein VIY52_32550 [Streptosporangiaceae bacterium]